MPNLPPRRLAVALTAAVALLGTSACAAGNDTTAGQGDASADRIFNFGIQAAPNSLDPAQLHDGQQRYVWGSLYDVLLFIGPDGEVQPHAAESWEYSDDGLTLTLNLRDDLTFSDGEAVTSEDVKATLERTRDTAGSQQSNLAAIETIDTPDEHTVVLNLSQRDPNLLVSLTYGAGAIGDADTINNESTALDPVGSGPYVLNKEETVDGSRYVLDRRDDHWNVDEYPFETVVLRVLPDRTALFNALVTGELSAGGVQATQVEAAEGAGFTVTEVEDVAIAELMLADREGEVAPALADVRVRQAISHAFDRPAMVDALLLGLGEPTTQQYSKLFSGYVPELEEEYEYNPEEARRLLAEAGYADGFRLEMPSNPQSEPFQATISQALADIGIEAVWEPVPAQQAGARTEWGAYWNFGSTAPASRTTQFYMEPGGSQNPFGSEDPELNALLEEVAQTTDPDRAAEIYEEINRWSLENAWFATVFSTSSSIATEEGVEFRGSAATLNDLLAFGVVEE